MPVPSKRPEHCSGFSFFKSDQDGRKGKDEGVVSYARSCAVDCAKGRMTMLDNLNEHVKGYEEIYKLHIPNSVEPALIFDPVLPGMKFETERKPVRISSAPSIVPSGVPKNLEDLAFASVRELAELIRTKKVSSLALTE